jgi:hypothetical protein
MRNYVKCLRDEQDWCTHSTCVETEEERIEALPPPPHDPTQERVQTRINAAGQREYRVVQYTHWRVVPVS